MIEESAERIAALTRKILIAVAVFAALAGGGWAGLKWYQRWLFPYGASHCCISQFGLSLHNCAATHDGRFPSGESSPEASLSLIYEDTTGDEGRKSIIQVLRGKTVPTETVRAILESGGLLTPETCGWHYVEGLTIHDDSNIAVVWDKTPGLSHNGMRTGNGGREVAFLSGVTEWIPGDEWPAFLEKQANLLAARKVRADTRSPDKND